MAPDAITIRYPDGAWEYGVTDMVPEVGGTLERRGRSWVVVSVTATSNTHRLVRVTQSAENTDE